MFLSLLMMMGVPCWAQMPGGKAIEVSHKTQVMNGKRYFVHIVDQGQTVYSIARAYGLKEVEAVTKKDIHFLQIGDTVWLPCKGQKLSDGFVAPKATEGIGATTSANNSAADKADDGGNAAVQGTPATIRSRVNPQSIVVSLMMPLNLSQMDKISTSKFDVEQRGKIAYKSLEFIQFYEGLLMGLDRLEKMGYNVTLNVVDVEGTSDEEVERAFKSHQVAQSDLLIAMLTRQPFEKAAQLARESQLFIVNPVSDRSEIVVGNPYVFKCQPSVEALAKNTVRIIHRTLPNLPIYIVHSGAKAEQAALAALTAELQKHDDMPYTLLDWAHANKFSTMLKGSGQSVVISLYSQDKAKNRIFATQLLNKLSAFKSRTPYLVTFDDWTTSYNDVDFAQLQNLNYHTYYAGWDMGNPQHKDFVDRFNDRFKTEPTSTYAGMANDIILYFVTGIQQKGTDFFKSPAIVPPQGMLYPLSFSHTRADYGFENQQALLYKMTDFHLNPIP